MDLRRKGAIREIFPEEFQNQENDPSGVLKAFLDIVDAQALTGARMSSSSASSESSLSSTSLSSMSSDSSSMSSDSSSSSWVPVFIKSSSGLLYGRDSSLVPFTSGDLSHWDVPLVDYSLSISSGMIRLDYPSVVSGPTEFRNNQIPSRSKTYLFAKYYAPDNGADSLLGLAAHEGDIYPPNHDSARFAFFTRRSQTVYLYEVLDGVYNSLDSLVSGFVNPGTYSFWMFADGANVSAYDTFNLTDFSGVCTILSSGTVGFSLGGWNTLIYCVTFFAMSDRYVTVNGLETGDTVEVRKSDDTVLASASESGGTALVDLYKVTIIDCNKIVVVRGAVDEFTYTAGTGEFICGGDIYSIV